MKMKKKDIKKTPCCLMFPAEIKTTTTSINIAVDEDEHEHAGDAEKKASNNIQKAAGNEKKEEKSADKNIYENDTDINEKTPKHNNGDQNQAKKLNLPNQLQTTQDQDKNMLENVEHFGSLIGEELVNTYWRRGFNMPAPLTTATTTTVAATTTTTATTLNANKNFQIPNHHQHHSHPHPPPMHPNAPYPPRFPTHSMFSQHSHPPHQQQQQQQQPQGPSSTALLSQLVNSTFSTTTHPSLRTDAIHHTQHFQQQQQQHQQSATNMDGEKLLHHHNESSTSASTPNLCEASRLADQEHLHGTHSLNGSMSSLSMSLSKFHEDNNNSLCATPNSQSGLSAHPHLPSGFLPGLPFQFQDRGHFRFADDLQLPPGASMAGRLGESLIPKGDPMEAKLQEMLRYNMDKYANQALDTLHISRRVRELLSVHNIGQRLFAKYILGLSQGTVSELLSKPKPWDKLTEKGRDSYRKMHAWGCDDNAVMLLKSLIPKKGK